MAVLSFLTPLPTMEHVCKNVLYNQSLSTRTSLPRPIYLVLTPLSSSSSSSSTFSSFPLFFFFIFSLFFSFASL